MASGAETLRQEIKPPAPPPSRSELFIQQQLRRTQRQVKQVDVAGGLMGLGAAVLIYLLLVAVVDQWLVSGGLGFWGRLLLWTAMVVVGGWYFAVRVLPPLRHRINPVYAAQTIEKSSPSFKNSLINFLLLRGRRSQVASFIYTTVEERAASDLSHVEVEAVVDRRPAYRLSYLLVAALAAFAIYLVLSPKSPLTSAARVLWPWANIEAPTRVTIRDVQPGDDEKFLGDVVTVSAEVHGLRDGEPVLMYFSTADGQVVDEAIPMELADGDYRHQANLPPGSLGLQQDYTYYITAGDYTTPRFSITVQVAPAILVDSIEYDYPAYTGIAPATIDRQGDIRAIEGTRVTVRASANQEIRRAEIDLGCDGRHLVGMKPDGRKAVGGFQLALARRDPPEPKFDRYQLRFTDQKDRRNPRPIGYRIEVIPDFAPRIELLEPKHNEVVLAADGRLEIRVRAVDPDFALRKVALEAEHENGPPVPLKPLLERPSPQEPHAGEFEATYLFEPARLGLKPGQRVAYWAEAEDNREPEANKSRTEQRWIRIALPQRDQQPTPAERPQPEQNPQPQEQPGKGPNDANRNQQPTPAENPKPGEEQPKGQPKQPGEQAEGSGAQQGGEQQGAGQQGAGQKEGSGQKGQEQTGPDGAAGSQSTEPGQKGQQEAADKQGDRPPQPIDPNTNPGDAFEEMLRDLHEKQAEQQPGQQNPGEQPNQQQPGQQQPGEQQPGQEQPGQQQPGQQQPGQQQPGEPSGGQQDGQSGQQPGTPSGQQQPGQQPGQQQGGTPGQNQPGQQAGQPDASQTGAQPGQQAPKQPGGQPDQQPGTQPGQQQPGQQPGQQQPGQQPGQQQPGQTAAGQKQPGETSPSGQQGPQQQPGQPEPGGPSGTQSGQQQPGEENRQPGQSPPGATPEKPEPGQQGTKPQEGGQMQPDQSSPGAGQQSEQTTGSPSPQETNQEHPKHPGQSGDSQQQPPDPAQSPSVSPRQSDSQGPTAGDRSGGGQQGGGQRANKEGVGSAGSHTDAESGGAPSSQKGEGETGSRGGDQVQSDRSTGQTGPKAEGGRAGSRTNPGGEAAGSRPEQPGEGSPQPGGPGQESGQPKQQGGPAPPNGTSGGPGAPAGGGAGPPKQLPEQQPVTSEPGGDDPNLKYAREQTDLALNHLKDELAKQEPDLLDRLGWDRQQAQQFLDRWQKMKEAAGRDDPQGREAKRQLDDALKSLGLDPRGTQIQGGRSGSDRLDDLRDAGRFEPPADWAEWYKAYTRGVAGGSR